MMGLAISTPHPQPLLDFLPAQPGLVLQARQEDPQVLVLGGERRVHQPLDDPVEFGQGWRGLCVSLVQVPSDTDQEPGDLFDIHLTHDTDPSP